MDYIRARKALRQFWIAYAVLMMVLPIGLMFLQQDMTLLVITLVGIVLFWAARDSLHVRKAALVLQGFFVFVLMDCIAALCMGNILPTGLSLSMIAISLLSLFVWRKAGPPAAEEPPPPDQ